MDLKRSDCEGTVSAISLLPVFFPAAGSLATLFPHQLFSIALHLLSSLDGALVGKVGVARKKLLTCSELFVKGCDHSVS